MTLQERVLEVIGQKALTARALFQALTGEQPAAIECALTGLLKQGVITLELGHYQLSRLTRLKPQVSSSVVPFVPRMPAVTVAPVGSEPSAKGRPARRTKELTQREREVVEMIGRGMTSSMIGQQLKTAKGNVDYWRWNACRKLGLHGKTELIAWLKDHSLPPAISSPAAKEPTVASAAVKAPLKLQGTTFAEEKPNGRRITFSPDLSARLVELQRSKAMTLQAALDRVSFLRQELADIEELVRMATQKDAVQ